MPLGLGWAGGALLVIGVSVALALLSTHRQSPLRRAYAAYEKRIAAELEFLFLHNRLGARRLVVTQLVVVAGIVLAGLLMRPALCLLAVPRAVGPAFVLDRLRLRRLQRIEQQLDTWLLTVANSLKASGSVGEALESSGALVTAPIAEEVDLILKEIRLGTPVATALRSASRRIGSRTVTSALATIIVGSQTGGDLPRILEETAAVLREMARLEATHRTKTSDGRAQVSFMALMPFLLVGALYLLDDQWLTPLTSGLVGNLILVIGGACWIGSVLLARKILRFSA